MFARLEESHVGELPAAITSGLGGSERRGGGLSIPLPGQDNDGSAGDRDASGSSQKTRFT